MSLIALALSACQEAEPATETVTALGTGEGELDPEGAGWTYILGEDEKLSDPRDLAFDALGNLWIANRTDDRTFIVSSPGTDAQEHDRRKDAGAAHFMEETAAFSFEDEAGAEQFGQEFASCGESDNTYNGQQKGDDFMGPVLWSADLEIFAEENPEGLGSHLDMLHQSPNCVGIAWERDNVYWVFDGKNDAIVRYDFGENHGIGMDDHSDGTVYRMSEPELKRVENAPGHLAIDPDTGLLYVADTGNGRVVRLDTAMGERGDDLRTRNEELDDHAEWEGADWSEFITGLDQPGGLALGGGYLYVGEFGTGILHAYDLDGNEVQSLDSGAGDEALYGIELGPDGDLWIIDHSQPAVLRLDPS